MADLCQYLSQPTPGQKYVSTDVGHSQSSQYYSDDDSQTSVKQILRADRITVTDDNVHELFNGICEYSSPPQNRNWPLITKLQEYFVSLTEPDFISRVIAECVGRAVSMTI